MTPSCRLSLLGAEVDAVTPDEVMSAIAQSVTAKRQMVIANHNLHSLYLFHRRSDMRAFYDKADLIEIDSTPMILWGRLLGKDVSRAHRCTYLDFRESFWARAQSEGWRVCHVGGAPAHNPLSKAAILKRFPQVHLDMHTGYFDVTGADNERLLAELAVQKPDVLLVGMGMPRQELWILNNLKRLPECAIMPIGAAFDYEAGVMYTPPRWTGQMGIEWLVRFFHEPKRLFSRYFLEPWVLIPHAMRDLMRRKPR
jgi:N-acetylglucosaminyldiphosphoundecaprenol N-acetyl-beta-D-mannosaminyltransferase